MTNTVRVKLNLPGNYNVLLEVLSEKYLRYQNVPAQQTQHLFLFFSHSNDRKEHKWWEMEDKECLHSFNPWLHNYPKTQEANHS